MTNSLKILAMAAVLGFSFSSNAADKVLKVGTEATFAPFEFMDENSRPTGFDIDIITAIAEKEGYKVEINNMGFDALIPSLMTSQIDAVIAAMTITEERAQKVDFTDPYYTSGLSILIKEDNKDKYASVDDLKGQRLCAQIGTTGAMTAEKLSPGNVGTYNTEPEAFMELKNGGCAAVVNDRPVNLYFLAQSASKGVYELPDRIGSDVYGIAVRKGNTEMLNLLNNGLKSLKESGEFEQIHKKWFGVEK